VRTAGQVAFFETEIEQHLCRNRDVFGFPSVRPAGQCNLVIAPSKPFEPIGRDQWHQLESLGAGSPGDGIVGTASSGDQAVLCIDDRRVHVVPGLYVITARHDNVEIQVFHVGGKIMGAELRVER
jgi:hypothetical protein